MICQEEEGGDLKIIVQNIPLEGTALHASPFHPLKVAYFGLNGDSTAFGSRGLKRRGIPYIACTVQSGRRLQERNGKRVRVGPHLGKRVHRCIARKRRHPLSYRSS